MPSPLTVTVLPAARVRGRVRPPGDKSISHRYGMLAAIAKDTSWIRGYSTGGDCRSTLDCLRALGVSIEELERTAAGLTLRITGRGPGGLRPAATALDAGNSGSTLVAGTTVTSSPSALKGVQVTSTATCGAGKVLLGGGSRVTTNDTVLSRAVMVSSYPSSTTTWTAIGVVSENLTTGKTMSVTAYALCSP